MDRFDRIQRVVTNRIPALRLRWRGYIVTIGIEMKLQDWWRGQFVKHTPLTVAEWVHWTDQIDLWWIPEWQRWPRGFPIHIQVIVPRRNYDA